MLTGPTGTGKSQLARRVYELRHHRGGLDGPMVEVNCATLTGDTAASALFGHIRGSFPGAQKDRPGLQITFNKEARDAFLRFAEAADTPWHGNFRDFNAAIVRMGTLAQRGRIRREDVDEEIARLHDCWQRPQTTAVETVDLSAMLDPGHIEELGGFDRVQLAHVVAVCQRCKSISEAGRELFAVSRTKRLVTNDSDRLIKYLAK